MKTYIIDVECYVNYFLICAVDYTNPTTPLYVEIFNNKTTIKDFKPSELLANNTIVTFNGQGYDLPMITALCNKIGGNKALKRLSDQLIVDKFRKDFIQPKAHYDLFNISPGMSSLKIYGARLGTKTIQELPIHPDSRISEKLRQDRKLRKYCFNDCLVTVELARSLKDQLNLRNKMSKTVGTDLKSKSDAQIAEAVISKMHGRYIKRPDFTTDPVVFDTALPFTFKTEKLQQALEKAYGLEYQIGGNGGVLIPKEMRQPIELFGKKYQIGVGGLHSTEKSQYREECEGMALVDLDVASYYPSLILNQDATPKALKGSFKRIYSDLVDQRLDAKRTGDKTTADTLKITINGAFGKFGSKYSFLYAPKLLLQTTLSGQMYLLYLIESMERAGFEVISANTDGIVIYYKKSNYEKLKSIAQNWMDDTKLVLEDTHYQLIASRDVNNYVAITTDGEVKRKGVFAKNSLSKNPAFNVVNLAVIANLKDGIDVEQTIRSCADIKEFCSVRKVTGGAEYNEMMLGSTVRFYYSQDAKGYIQYCKNGNKVPMTDGALPCQVLPDNLPKNIDYQRYINLAKEALKNVGAGYRESFVLED